MKKTLIYIMTISLFITSCDKKLDIAPTQSIDETKVLTSDANVKAALNGAYDAASNGYLLGGDLQLFSELLAADGEIRWDGTFNQPREVFNKKILTNNSYVSNIYINAYRTINICNNILSAIAIVNTADQNRVKGEALLLRGEMYFELVKLFAKPYSAGNVATALGMPLISTPTIGNISDANFVPRSTLQDTYAFVLKDLTDAKGLLPVSNGIYATSGLASAFLSRVYLQMADYAKARDEANSVITSNKYRLTTTYSGAFNNTSNSTEDIFAIQITAQDGTNDMHVFWSTLANGARNGDVDVLTKHVNQYEAGDARRSFFYADGSVFRSGKWRLQYRNLPVVRLAEMYLTRAESNFRLGTNIGATPAQDINVSIRSRVGLGAAIITLDAIIKERKLELAHEGQAIHDIKRLRKSVDGYAYNANELVLPIPIREINAVGPNILKQNEGY